MLCIGLEWRTVLYVRRIQPKEPQLSHSIPNKPVGTDLYCWNGKDYLVIVDYRTDFFEICKLQQTTTASVVEATKEHSPGTGFLLQYPQIVVLNSHLESSRHLQKRGDLCTPCHHLTKVNQMGRPRVQ